MKISYHEYRERKCVPIIDIIFLLVAFVEEKSERKKDSFQLILQVCNNTDARDFENLFLIFSTHTYVRKYLIYCIMA